jgi:hypothetical protein
VIQLIGANVGPCLVSRSVAQGSPKRRTRLISAMFRASRLRSPVLNAVLSGSRAGTELHAATCQKSPLTELQTSPVYVRFEVFTAVTMKNAVFWDIKTKFVPHRKHYVSATDHSRLLLCKIWDFHGGDCEECRLLGCDVVRLL